VTRIGRTLAGLGAVLLVAVSGCSDRETDSDRATGSRPPSASTGPATSPSATTAPWTAVPGLGRCGPQPPRLAGEDYRTLTLRGAGRKLPAVTAGRGSTVVVLVHQTDGGGLCGWLDFAARVASVPGQTALAFDLCGYADAVCDDGSTRAAAQVEQVRLAIDAAVGRLRARRVVVVGASMGGSLAVLTAAADPRVDAVVDLSGPDEWRGVAVHRRARDVRVPLLVAMADSEGPDQMAAARATAQAAGPASALVAAPTGHGYELLVDATGEPTQIAQRVLSWIAG
jgi:dienelactone hydrolase